MRVLLILAGLCVGYIARVLLFGMPPMWFVATTAVVVGVAGGLLFIHAMRGVLERRQR